MKMKIITIQRRLLTVVLTAVTFFMINSSKAATITSTATGGTWATPGTWVGGVAPSSTDQVVIATTGTNSVSLGAAATCAGLTINSGAILNVGAFAITVNGNTDITGTFNLTSATGNKTFNGDITINSGGVWNESAAIVFSCSGNFTNNAATFTANTGVHTFSGSAKSFAGSTEIVIPSVTISGSYTNNQTLRVKTALAGAGSLIQGTGSVLKLGGTAAITSLDATTNVNTVDYTGEALAAQTIRAMNFYHLSISSFYGATTSAALTVNGNLLVSGMMTTGNNLAWNLTVNGSTTITGVLNLNQTSTKTFTGDFSNVGQIIVGAAGTVNFGGNVNNDGDFTTTSGTYNFTGTSKIITGSSVISLPTLSFSGSYTNQGLLEVTTALNGTTGTLTNGASGVLYIAFAGPPAITNLLTTTTGNTVNYNLGGAQTVKTITYDNLTLSNSSAKTMTGVTVNGILSMEGTATATVAPTFGSNSSLKYNRTSALACGPEWISPFTGSGGVIIANTGAVSLNAAKVLGLSVPLRIDSASTLNTTTSNYQLSFGGDYIKHPNGVFIANASPIVITNTMATQSIEGFSTTGAVTMSKTSGTATLQSNTSMGSLTIDGGSGATSTLHLGDGLTHTVSGSYTRNNGSINCGSSILKIGGAVSVGGGSGTFIPGTGTVEYYASTAQTVYPNNYYNLILSGSGIKTLTGLSTVNGNFTLSGTATATTAANLTIGKNLIIENTTLTIGAYNFTVNGTTTIGSGTSGSLVISSATGLKTFVGNVLINAAATWNNSGNSDVTFQNGIENSGTFNAGSGVYYFTTNSQELIGTFNIPSISVTSPAVVNNEGTVTVTTALSGTGTFNNDPVSTLNINFAGVPAITSLIAEGGENTVSYGYAGAQTIFGTNYQNLTLAGSGTKTFLAGTTMIDGNVNINTGVVAKLTGATSTHVHRLFLGGAQQHAGTWGSSTSSATNTNNTFFDNSVSPTYILNVITDFVTWTGAVSTNWFTAGNWSGGVPTAELDAIIPVVSNKPSIGASGAVCKNITINASSSLTILTTNVLTLHGNWLNYGTFNRNSSTVIFAGTDQTQTIAGTSPQTFTNLNTGSNSVTITAVNVAVAGNLTVGSLTYLKTGANYTLSITGTSTINGIVELRYSGAKTFSSVVNVNTDGKVNIYSGSVTFSSSLICTNGGTSVFGGTVSGTTVDLRSNGALNINAGASTFTAIGVYGSLNVYGGTLTATVVRVATSGAFNITEGNASVTLSRINCAGTFTMNGGYCLSNTGLDSFYSTAVWNMNAGTYRAYKTQPTIVLEGTANQTGGSVILQISGGTAGNNDFQVKGTYNQSGGILDVDCMETIGSVTSSFNQTGSSAVLKLRKEHNDYASDVTSVYNFTSTAGTVEFMSINSGGKASFAAGAGTRQHANIIIRNGANYPKFNLYTPAMVYISGDFTNFHPSMASGMGTGVTFIFNGTGDQVITNYQPASAMGNIIINKPSGKVVLGSNLVLSGNFSVVSGTFDPNGYTLTINGTFSSFTGGTILVDASNFGGNYTKSPATCAAGTTVIYNANTAQTVANLPYSNLTFKGSGNKTFTLGLSIGKELAIYSSAIADLIGNNSWTCNTLSFNGENQPTGTHGSLGSGATYKTSTFFYNSTKGMITVLSCTGLWVGGTSGFLTDWNTASNWCSNSVPLVIDDVYIPNVTNMPVIGTGGGTCKSIKIGTGATLNISGFATLSVGGDWTNNGTFVPNSSTVNFNGSDQNFDGTQPSTFYNLVKSGNKALNLGTLAVTARNLTIDNSEIKSTTGTLSITGNFINNGTFTDNNGMVAFTGNILQSIGGTSVTTFNNLNINNTPGTTAGVELNKDAVSGSTIISSSGLLTIKAAKTLTTTSLTSPNATNLVLESNSTGTGNLLYSGSSTVYGTVQRYMTGKAVFPPPYHFISSPVNNAPVSCIWQAGDYYPMNYTETIDDPDLDIGWALVRSGNLENARGYALPVKVSSKTVSFPGALNIADMTYRVDYTPTPGPYGHNGLDPRGWNLVGNPYPCAIDAKLFLSTNFGILDAFYGYLATYIWDDQDGDRNENRADYNVYTYLGYAGTKGGNESAGLVPVGKIAVGQGFFIKVKYSGSIAFNSSMKVGNSSNQFFVPDVIPDRKIKLGILTPDSIYNEILIGFLNRATDGIDEYDVVKLKGNQEIALYSILDQNDLIVQGLPSIELETVIPVGYDNKKSATLTFITVPGDEFDYSGVYLEDLKEHKLISLRDNPSYTFTSDTGSVRNRFVLRCFKADLSGVDEQEILNGNYYNPIKIYATGNTVHIVNLSSDELKGNITVCDILGKQVMPAEYRLLDNDSTINITGKSGYYFVTVVTEKGTRTAKVFIP